MPLNIVLKGIGGFYYVKTDRGIIECKAKGQFRKLSLSPVAVDIVDISFEDGINVISEIHTRKNKFVRPPFANLDLLVLVISTTDPSPNFLLADKMRAIARHKDVDVAVVVSKSDIYDFEYIKDIYTSAGFKVFITGGEDKSQVDRLKKYISGKLCAFAGNSGVGKSTLLNKLFPDLDLATGITSKKLGRGKHTTRRVEIFDTDICLVADTPGFSSLELDDDNFISKDDLQYAFKEFAPYIGKCRFNDCSHTNEKDCAVKAAVESKDISESRYESYVTLYNRQKNIKDWQI